MTVDQSFKDNINTMLASLGNISFRAMFGGYGIFSDNKMFALISGSKLYFKADESNINLFLEAHCQQYKPMPYYEVPEAVMDNPVQLQEWARMSIAIPTTSKKKRLTVSKE